MGRATRQFLAPFALLLAFAALDMRMAGAEFADFRALWVSRFEYSTSSPGSVSSVIANAASMGVTDVLFQVRGKSDAYYQSNFEPRAERLSGSWDPLQTAINAGQANGVRIHAWLNSMPLWRDTAAPTDSSHPFFNSDPSFRRFDINGVPENPTSQNGEYASANPILPEVHTHINNVVDDILANYDVDGIHLDYIRWIGNQNFNTLPHDAQSHQMFMDDRGLDASNPTHAGAYRTYIKDRVTDLVSSVKSTVDAAEVSTGRTVDLSAAVWRDPDIAENERLQDYRTWLEDDLLDIAMPMIYLSSSNNHLLIPNLTNTLNIPTNTRIAPGLGAFLHTSTGGGVQETLDQLDILHDFGTDGATFFSYSNFFGSDPLASQRRDAVVEYYDQLDGGPGGGGANVIDDFDVNEGHFGWAPNFSGSNQGIGAGSTAERTTSEAYEGVGAQEIFVEGDANGWFLRHLSGIGRQVAAPAGNEPLTAAGNVGFWLMTNDPGLTVQIALDDPETADRGFEQEVIADGQWHLYEWDLENDAHWEGWVNGNGMIDGASVTIDSIQFSGAGDALFYLDSVSHNPNGSLLPSLTEGDFNGDGLVDDLDFAAWETGFGSQGDATLSDGDANGDGHVTGDDFATWQRNVAPSAAPSAAAVPEPAAGWLALFAAWLARSVRPKKNRRDMPSRR